MKVDHRNSQKPSRSSMFLFTKEALVSIHFDEAVVGVELDARIACLRAVFAASSGHKEIHCPHLEGQRDSRSGSNLRRSSGGTQMQVSAQASP